MKNKRLLWILPLLLLVGCEYSFNSSSSTSDSTSNSNSEPSKPSLPSTNSGSVPSVVVETSLAESDFLSALNNAIIKDKDFSQVSTTRYSYSKNSYTVQKGEMHAYNNAMIINGSTTQTSYSDWSKISSNSVEQRLYQDGYYTRIKKFDSSYVNQSQREEMTSEQAQDYIEIGQSKALSTVISTFKKQYSGIVYHGVIEEDIKHVTYLYVDESTLSEAHGFEEVFCAVIEAKFDAEDYMLDFYYSEAYYDKDHTDDVSRMRRRGPSMYTVPGYTFEAHDFVKGERSSLENLQFALEENFIQELSFTNTEVTISLSEITTTPKYINLIDYITTNPQCGETSGCPVSNLSFTSSNSSVGQVNDQFYLDFSGVGETTITATDSAFGVTSSNSMKVIVVE